MLAKNEIDAYIDKIIVPAFVPLIDKKVSAVIWDCSGNFIISTDKYAQIFGFKTGIEMKKYHDLFPLSRAYPTLTMLSSEILKQVLYTLDKIIEFRQEVITNKTPVQAVIIHPFINVFNTVIMTNIEPIFHNNGEIIAVKLTINNFILLGLREYLLEYYNSTSKSPPLGIIQDHKKLPIQITQRQHEILFLIAIGLPQCSVADVLNISRGAVAKTLYHRIASKLKLETRNEFELMQSIKQLNIHKYIPKSLCRPWVIKLHVYNFFAYLITEINEIPIVAI